MRRICSARGCGMCRRVVGGGAQFTPVLYDENHAHEHAELCLLIEGHCVFSLDHAASVLNPATVARPAGRPHGETFVRAGMGYRLVWWSLHRAYSDCACDAVSECGGSAGVSAEPAGITGGSAGAGGPVAQAGEAKNAPAVEALRESMLTLALALYRRVLDGGEAQVDTRAQLVRRAVEFVRAQSDRPLALADVAHAVHVSPNYLTGLFRAETGTPLGRFILAERIAGAQKLRQPAASVKAVALELGFADPFTFSRAFKRVTGRHCGPGSRGAERFGWRRRKAGR